MQIRCLHDMYMNDTNNTDVVNDMNFIDCEVKSEIEAYELYYWYVHKFEFIVRKKHHSYWSNFRKIKPKDFVCSKVGYKKGLDHNWHLKYQKSTFDGISSNGKIFCWSWEHIESK